MNAIPIKVQCGCGQRYAFEVVPEGGQMPGAVACPVCGADGTAAANMMLAQQLTPARPAAVPGAGAGPAPARVAAPAAPAVRMGVAAGPGGPMTAARVAAAPAVSRSAAASGTVAAGSGPGRPTGLLPGQVGKDQARVEARAKILWGDEKAEVEKYLRMQGFTAEEGKAMVAEFMVERAATIRSNGTRRIIIGIGLICVPIVAAVVFAAVGYFPLKLFGATVAVGLYGLWQLIKGMLMVFAPGLETGDASES